jgi:predicted peroxiredoxin
MTTDRTLEVSSVLMYVGTHGPQDATRACMPFYLAVASVAEVDSPAIVHLRGDAVTLLCDDALATVAPIDMPPLRDLLAQARQHAIPIYV